MKRLTIEERSTMISLLKKAKASIKDGSSCFVCWAIDDIGMTSWRYSGVVDYLTDWVEKMLDGHDSLHSWLDLHPDNDMYDLFPQQVKDSLRDTRVLWINWMIKQLKDGK